MLSLKEGISIEADWVGMYFDAVVVEVKKKVLLLRLALVILWDVCQPNILILLTEAKSTV